MCIEGCFFCFLFFLFSFYSSLLLFVFYSLFSFLFYCISKCILKENKETNCIDLFGEKGESSMVLLYLLLFSQLYISLSNK